MKTQKVAKRVGVPLRRKGNGKSTYLSTGLFRPRSLVQSLARILAIFQFKKFILSLFVAVVPLRHLYKAI